MMKCKNCGEELNERIKFCPRCGEKVELKRYCRECGAELETSAKFCFSCGSPADGEGKVDVGKGDITQKKTIAEQDKKIETLKDDKFIKDIPSGQPAILQNMNNHPNEMKFVEKKKHEEMEIKHLRYKIGFKWALLIAFIAFFMPFCTVSCGQQVLLSSNGYELTGTWGMTSEQMELYELAPADMGNYMIIIVLILMILAVIIVNGKIIKTAQTGIAALILFIFAHAQEWDEIRNIGCQVNFGYGYYLALIFLILSATAFLWAPAVVGKLEEFFVSNRNNVTGNERAGHFLKKVNVGLFCMLVAVIVTAFYTYQDSFGAWKDVFDNRGKIPDLKDNIPLDMEYEWWDEKLLEDETEDIDLDDYFEEDNESPEIKDANASIQNENELANSDGEYILPASDSRYLTEADLIGLDKATLRLARNEIYARHGRIFQSEDLNNYFSSKSWYIGYLLAEEFDDSVFNAYEKANLQLIQQMEN